MLRVLIANKETWAPKLHSSTLVFCICLLLQALRPKPLGGMAYGSRSSAVKYRGRGDTAQCKLASPVQTRRKKREFVLAISL